MIEEVYRTHAGTVKCLHCRAYPLVKSHSHQTQRCPWIEASTHAHVHTHKSFCCAYNCLFVCLLVRLLSYGLEARNNLHMCLTVPAQRASCLLLRQVSANALGDGEHSVCERFEASTKYTSCHPVKAKNYTNCDIQRVQNLMW